MHGTPVTVAAVYPQSTLKGTPTCRSLNITVSYENYVASQRNLGVYMLICSKKITIWFFMKFASMKGKYIATFCEGFKSESSLEK